jgi:hypothetical protein
LEYTQGLEPKVAHFTVDQGSQSYTFDSFSTQPTAGNITTFMPTVDPLRSIDTTKTGWSTLFDNFGGTITASIRNYTKPLVVQGCVSVLHTLSSQLFTDIHGELQRYVIIRETFDNPGLFHTLFETSLDGKKWTEAACNFTADFIFADDTGGKGTVETTGRWCVSFITTLAVEIAMWRLSMAIGNYEAGTYMAPTGLDEAAGSILSTVSMSGIVNYT